MFLFFKIVLILNFFRYISYGLNEEHEISVILISIHVLVFFQIRKNGSLHYSSLNFLSFFG